MRDLSRLDEWRVPAPELWDNAIGDNYNGAFILHLKGSNLAFKVLATNTDGWDHVSVSTDFRCPRWHEMQMVKELFFEDEEVAMQLHPPNSDYRNCHPYCLHMWRPQNATIPLPSGELVAPK